MHRLIPVDGCWIATHDEPARYGCVKEQIEGERIRVDFGPNSEQRVLQLDDWRCGFHPGFTVKDIPISAARKTLGLGTVVGIRELAGREQVSVHFHATGELRWLPFERLVRIMDPRLQFLNAQQTENDAAERTSVNLMAHALRSWNEATGALERLDIDPLPHQISLVHRIVNSASINWLIADDVGLGKTIEVGMLLGALERGQNVRRVLIIVPSGLTRQWKDEMESKFDRDFRIYGRDFQIERAKDWGWYDQVITSLDLVKPRDAEDAGGDFETRFGKLLAAKKWDLVIFDEAHRLSRDDTGRTTLRYRLAKELRERTDKFLLLTGTPHQGDAGRFQNLLRLVRPDLDAAIRTLDDNPEIVAGIVLRNRKIDAVDAEGNFIFHGLLVKRAEIPLSGEVAELEKRLSNYLRRGYRAGELAGGKQGRAIGFVMTIYRKLASSSVYALALAMLRRKNRLSGIPVSPGVTIDEAFWTDAPSAEQAESEDDLANAETADLIPFFDEEIAYIDGVIEQAKKCILTDQKLKAVLDLVDELVVESSGRLLIFTEYRATQSYLATRIAKLTGRPPLLIHGGHNVDQKRQAVEDFDGEPNVLISTEAGGEGLNLQRNCHVMVNYDLPWNPSRLTQRIGRLYRYGQHKKVVVINLHARDTIDNEILSTVLERLDVIVSQMAPVNAEEFDDKYRAEVMGELLERLDIQELLDEASEGKVDRSADRIDSALRKAQEAKSLQDEILSHASGLEGESWERLGSFTPGDVAIFIERSCRLLDIGFTAREGDRHRFELRLPDEMRGKFPEFGHRTVIEATTRRGDTSRLKNIVLLDFAAAFLRHLVTLVTAPEFGGGYGMIARADMAGAVLAAFLARFQNDQGHPTGEDLMVGLRAVDGSVDIDTSHLRPLFRSPQVSSEARRNDPGERKESYEAIRDQIELMVADRCSRFRHPNSIVPIGILEG